MALFKKRSPEPSPSDEALPFFSETEANTFRALAREVFAERGIEVVVHPDHALDDSGRGFGFWNVAALCRDAQPNAWRQILNEHVEGVIASLATSDPFASLDQDEAAQRTYARLYEHGSIPSPDNYPHREFVPGVIEMLALDLPDSVAVFDHERAKRFGGWERLRAAGMANLASLPVEALETLKAPDGSEFTALLGDSFYTASRALALPELASRLTGEAPSAFGWLMSIPSRHHLAWHFVRDMTVVGAINGMAQFTASSFADSPGPVSPHVYWWNGSAYEQLTHVADDGSITIRPSAEFVAALNSLAALQ